MKKLLKWSLIGLVAVLLGYLVSVTAVDACLMGLPTPSYSFHTDTANYLIKDASEIDSQTGFKCSAFSSAYVLRHWGIEARGDSVYEIMPDKMENGYVYPKGIIKFLESNGLSVDYHIGNLTALKNEVAKGHPVIVMIKIRPDKDRLHYVPVVGYSQDSVYIAESIPELCNAAGQNYNRKISNEEFKVLWDTRAFKMPLYGNTFITANR